MAEESGAVARRPIAELRHDLRTPLNHIIGYGEMLLEDAEESEDEIAAGVLREIRATAQDLAGVIQTTLTPNKTEVTDSELAALRDRLHDPVQRILDRAAALIGGGAAASAKDIQTIRSAAERLLTLAGEAAPAAETGAPAIAEAASPPAEEALQKGSLLVVDDNASNRDMLSRRLERQGYAVTPCDGGRAALDAARRGGVDLVLLDVMMPEMDGYQVLNAMKDDEALRHIPVIMISALDDIQSVVRCIERGAEDYLPKPFDPVLLRARVGACLEKKRLRDAERRKTEELQQALARLKETQEQLVMNEKLASLGAVSAGIAHEIKNPLNFVTNFAEIAIGMTADLRSELPAAEVEKVADILDGLEQCAAKIREHGARADIIVRSMLLLSRGQSGERQKADVGKLLAEAASLAYHGLRAQDVSFECAIEKDFDPAAPEIEIVPQQLSRVFLNIVTNACYAVQQRQKAGVAGYRPTLALSSRRVGDWLDLRIRDNGTGIPEAVRKKIFDPFFTTKPAGSGTGLGLSISHEIVVQGHGGELAVDSVEGEFTEFTIKLPMSRAAAEGA